MKTWRFPASALLMSALMSLSATSSVPAAESRDFEIGGKFILTAPENWVSKPPANNVVEYEFQVPAAEGDEIAGRATVTGASGGVEANVDRWKNQQFKQPETGEVKAEVKEAEAAGQPIHFVTIDGTFLDKPGGGPFTKGPTVERENFRLLGAIITTKDAGQYFIKLVGPVKTVKAAEAGFIKMVEGLQAKAL